MGIGDGLRWQNFGELNTKLWDVDSGKENDYPEVNGVPIGPQARRLNDNDVVQLAGVKMGFFES